MTGADIVLLIGSAAIAGAIAYGFYLKHQIDVLDRRIWAREERAILGQAKREREGSSLHAAE